MDFKTQAYTIQVLKDLALFLIICIEQYNKKGLTKNFCIKLPEKYKIYIQLKWKI